MTKFKYVSLFSGIGGFEQGLNPIGGQCVMASEIDKFANQAYEVLYGEPTVGDVMKYEAKDVPDHDLLVGGFPCQAFSVAGKRGGFEDARGTLFFEVVRIMAEKKPRVALLENVKGLIGHDKGKTLDTIVKALNECGYRVDFNVLNSKYFGVPQNRERIFIVAIREDLVANEPWAFEGTNVVAKGKRRISGYDDVKTFNFDWPAQTEVITRLRDILETKVDERYYLSEEKTAKLVAQLEQRQQKVGTDDTSPEKIAGLYGMNKQAGSMWDVEKIAPTVKTPSGGNSEPIIAEQQSLDAGMKDNATKVREDGLASTLPASYYKGLCGQGRPFVGEEVEEVRPVLTPDRIEKHQNGRRFKEDGEEAFTLTSQDRHGVAFGVEPTYRIRKLTPLECFRLQGFSDEAHQALVDAGISNSQRYKMAGNAVTVNVIDALGAKLLPFLEV